MAGIHSRTLEKAPSAQFPVPAPNPSGPPGRIRASASGDAGERVLLTALQMLFLHPAPSPCSNTPSPSKGSEKSYKDNPQNSFSVELRQWQAGPELTRPARNAYCTFQTPVIVGHTLSSSIKNCLNPSAKPRKRQLLSKRTLYRVPADRLSH